MNILHKIKCKIYRFLLKNGMLAPKVVLLMDGGVCSQMHQYLLGHLLGQKGYRVEYDLTFFKEWGSDMDYHFVRNFDLQKAFPYLSVKKASKVAVDVYKRKYYNLGNNTLSRENDFSFLQKKPPVYLGGYYHVPAYGKPASLEYFKSAVAYMQDRDMSSFFYFFSDEPDWVRDELIPQLYLTEGNCKVVDINGSDKGYMDLFLIACCRHQITSKGTLGKYGALLEDNPEKTVVLCDDEVEYPWKELFLNPVFL